MKYTSDYIEKKIQYILHCYDSVIISDPKNEFLQFSEKKLFDTNQPINPFEIKGEFTMNESSCFCLPKELLTSEFSEYSNKSKLLFAIVITEAETAKSLNELSSLIQKLGEKRVSALYHQVHTEMAVDESRGLNNV